MDRVTFQHPKQLPSLNNNVVVNLCAGCYGKHFGPKGVGYGLGAGTLQT